MSDSDNDDCIQVPYTDSHLTLAGSWKNYRVNPEAVADDASLLAFMRWYVTLMGPGYRGILFSCQSGSELDGFERFLIEDTEEAKQ